MSVRFKSPLISWLLALLLVVSQLLVTAHACTGAMGDMPAVPVSTHESMTSMDMGEEHCAGMTDSGADIQTTAAVCKVHCQKDAQSADNHVPTVQAPVLALLFFLTSDSSLVSRQLAVLSREPSLLVATSPPLRIQYQTFRS